MLMWPAVYACMFESSIYLCSVLACIAHTYYCSLPAYPVS